MFFGHKRNRRSANRSIIVLALLAVIAVATLGVAALVISGSLPQDFLSALTMIVIRLVSQLLTSKMW